MADKKLPEGCKMVNGKVVCKDTELAKQDMGKVEEMKCDRHPKTGELECITKTRK
jgi:hypothetical protein